jgi:YHS domain-containing protein
MKKYALIAMSVLGILSCHNNSQPLLKNNAPTMDSASVNAKARFKGLKFDNPNDLSCGMPLTAGLEDTVHYKGKLYGFCSKECKDAFLKDPASYLAQVK